MAVTAKLRQQIVGASRLVALPDQFQYATADRRQFCAGCVAMALGRRQRIGDADGMVVAVAVGLLMGVVGHATIIWRSPPASNACYSARNWAISAICPGESSAGA